MLAMAEQSESIKKAVVTLRQLTNDEKIKLVSYRKQLIHELHIAPDDSISQ